MVVVECKNKLSREECVTSELWLYWALAFGRESCLSVSAFYVTRTRVGNV